MTNDLLQKLENWARERRILPSDFACPYYQRNENN